MQDYVSWIALAVSCVGGAYLYFRDNRGDTQRMESRLSTSDATQKQHGERISTLERESSDVRKLLQRSEVDQAKMGEALKRIDSNVLNMATSLNDKLDKVAESLAHTQGEIKSRKE